MNLQNKLFNSKFIVIAILGIVLGILGILDGFQYMVSDYEEEVLNQYQSEWENVYLIEFAEIEDLPQLKELGAKQVLQEISLDPKYWDKYYQAIVINDLELIPVLWGNGQTAWTWNNINNEWELNINTYPKSIGAKFLKFLLDHPIYLKHTFAIYSFHEPLNYENNAMVSPERQKKFWRQIHEELFPENSLKIYGESISWGEECKNGCVDYDGLDFYYFSQSDDESDYMLPVFKIKHEYGLYFFTYLKTVNREKAINNAKERIDLFYKAGKQAPPAPDGSQTKFIPLIQTFAIQSNKKIWNRMPSNEEMKDWATKVIGSKKSKVAGMGWYCYRPGSTLYSQWLQKDRFDLINKDRWHNIKEISEILDDNSSNELTHNN